MRPHLPPPNAVGSKWRRTTSRRAVMPPLAGFGILSEKPRAAARRGASVTITTILDRAEAGGRLSATEALALAECDDLGALMRIAGGLRDRGHGRLVSYSRKVFIPLTHLCRDVCHYCTFAHPPRRGEAAYLHAEQVFGVGRARARGRWGGGSIASRWPVRRQCRSHPGF